MELYKELISKKSTAPKILLFGGHPTRRHSVIQIISKVGDVTVYGALSEAEGIQMLREKDEIDVVLIGGAYTQEQRVRIKAFIEDHDRTIKITEPGVEYRYSNENIQKDIAKKLGLKIETL
ncbi:hypothetical protein [uncultured Croceitalea sp.]|uniref:hypothetical protein n=1 Tax=uncultured Croceitalea sp. TaxID=1798908 RepID=UPI0033063742